MGDFHDELVRRLEGRRRRILERAARAAVLLPILGEGVAARFLLTRRTREVATHKGQVAFPGGFAEPTDGGAAATALREAREEVGLLPGEVRVLGLLDDFSTHDDAVAVTPVVAQVIGRPQLRVQASEVARIFEIPIAELERPERWRVQQGERHGRSYPVYYFAHQGEMLWGLSAYMVMHFLEVATGGAPHAAPDF